MRIKRTWQRDLSKRFMLSRGGRKVHLGTILGLLGLSIGITTLLTVLSVMNGFQQSFISDINEVYSYHLRIEETPLSPLNKKELSQVKGLRVGVTFSDSQGILSSDQGYTSSALIREINWSEAKEDTQFLKHLELVRGEYIDEKESQSLLIGYVLASSLSASVGDKLSLSGLGQTLGGGFGSQKYKVAGFFKTGYYEYDKNLCFLLDKNGEELKNKKRVYGIKLENHFKDRGIIDKILKRGLVSREQIVSWRVYNSGFFNALKIEKVLMLFVIGLIFIIVATNSYHAMRRSVHERIPEIALLKSYGALPKDILKIQLYQGLTIGILAALIGSLLAHLISQNINQIIGFFLNLYSGLTGQTVNFYFMNIPVILMKQDFFIVNFLAIISILIASFKAVKPYINIKPSEIFKAE